MFGVSHTFAKVSGIVDILLETLFCAHSKFGGNNRRDGLYTEGDLRFLRTAATIETYYRILFIACCFPNAKRNWRRPSENAC